MLDLNANEEYIFNYWAEHEIEQKVREKNKGNKIFFFLEGPPYANGELHLGHIRGYTRKDAVLRYKRLRGFDAYDRAGFDVHGLPIENKVERDLGIKSKKEIESEIGVSNFIDACIKLYKDNVKGQISVAKRYGVWMDFENPYIPASADYIDKAWGVFKKIYDKKLVYKDMRVMPYCMHCGTALAKGPEVEEQEDTDPSVYVLFRISDRKHDARIEIPDNSYFLVWTTTPWTLPANMALAVNPSAVYVMAKLEDKTIILAKNRMEEVSALLKSSLVITAEVYGSELKGIYYSNPLEEHVQKQRENWRFHRVLLSEENVNLDEGTGILHVAPAYGPEDFDLAKKNKIPIMSIVDLDGTYNELSGKYKGLKVIHEVNRAVETDLHSLGALAAKTTIRHNYPHCWRCKDKLVYLPTDQWFINIAKIKEKMKKESGKVDWHPSELKGWFIASIDQSPDWVISRQRYWGIPIPIWVCESCKEISVVGSIKDFGRQMEGEISSEKLHKPQIDNLEIKCAKCESKMHRVKDVFDVWYDSGVAHTSSISEENFKKMYSKAWITEGPDQIRGWFATLMKTGIAAYGKTPFNTVVMQGWVLDHKGEAMHKSKGNYVTGHELVGTVPIDAVRAFMLSHITEDNLKFSKIEIGEMQQAIGTLYNIANLVREYSQAIDYTPTKVKKFKSNEGLETEDMWILSRFTSSLETATASMEKYEVYTAINSILDFLINDFSRFYLKIAKKRILEGTKKGAKQKIDVITYVLHNMLISLSPFMPFSSEKLYLESYGVGHSLGIRKESIFLEDWPKFQQGLVNKELEKEFFVATETITAILNDREKAKVRLRWPLLSAMVEVTDQAAADSLEKLLPIVDDYTNIKKIEIKKVEGLAEEVRPNFVKLGPDFKDRASAVAEALRSADSKQLRAQIDRAGHYTLHTKGGVVDIKSEHFTLVNKAGGEDAIQFRYGRVKVDPRINEELREEAMVREFERRIQMERKEMGLKKVDRIVLSYQASGYMEKAIKNNIERIKKGVNAKRIVEGIKSGSAKEIDLEGEKISIRVEKREF